MMSRLLRRTVLAGCLLVGMAGQGLRAQTSDSALDLPLPPLEGWDGGLEAPPATLAPEEPAPSGADASILQPQPESLLTVGDGCQTCGGGSSGYPWDRCGCNPQLFPWITGPGNCDQWCVGPHWGVVVDGLILRRSTEDLGSLAAVVGSAPELIDQFDHGPGARVAATGYNASGFGMQIVYEGVNDYHASALFPLNGAVRDFTYESTFNSIEINFLPRTSSVWKLFGGFRYLEVDEDFVDYTTVDKFIPAPADPPAASAAYVDFGDSYLVENRLFGFQVGGFRDGWQLNRWFSLEGYCNAGVYLNDFKQETVQRTVTTVINGDDLATPTVNEYSEVVTVTQDAVTRNFSDMSLVGEAGLTGVLRLNPCIAVRGGYQALVTDGVGLAIDAFAAPGLNPQTIFYHGLHAGLEYRR